eukprot:TCONS_00058798-protein
MQTLPVIRNYASNKRSTIQSITVSRRSQRVSRSTSRRMSSLGAPRMPEITRQRSPARFMLGGDEEQTTTNETSDGETEKHSRKHSTLPRISQRRQRSSSVIADEEASRRQRSRSKTTTELHTSFAHVASRVEENKRFIIHDRVKEFMNKENPGRPPLTLRYVAPKQIGEETKLLLKPPKEKLPINTNSCPNLYLLTDRQKWSYNYKPGKCRYLRCPQSPVLQPEEIFSTE